MAARLHRENIERVVREAVGESGVPLQELSAIAATVKPGLALSLEVGLTYSLNLVQRYHKPFIPIHHMAAHALTVRMLRSVPFPFLVLLVSGGHCLLAVARGVSDFLLLGQSLDESPGDTLDKIARRLSLKSHPECCGMSGGEAIEHLAKGGDRLRVNLTVPMSRHLDCNFSFSGLRNQVTQIIVKKESEEGLQEGQTLTCAGDIAAAAQHTVAVHIAKRTHRAILFCNQEGLVPQINAALVVSGGVASNQYIRKILQIVTEANGFSMYCPPPQLCTDNGIMIAWNGVERLRVGIGIL